MKIIAPIPVIYTGYHADEHLVDAVQFSKSIEAVSRVANSAAHFWFFGNVAASIRRHEIHFFVKPAREGSYFQEIVGLLNGSLPLFPEALIKLSKPAIEQIINTIVKSRTSVVEAEMAIDKLHDLAVRHADFSREVHQGHMQDKAWLQSQIDHLTKANESSLRRLPEPVGRSVRAMQIGEGGEEHKIDAASAAALRSREPMEVGDEGEYVVEFQGVFKTNGACQVLIIPGGSLVNGVITDPAVTLPENVYTEALAASRRLRVRAKPVLKDGVLSRLFISNVLPDA